MGITALMRLCYSGAVVCAAWALPKPALTMDGFRQEVRSAYTVEVADTSARILHVTAAFQNLNHAELELSLPLWTPGWYRLEYYGRNVMRLEAKDPSGQRLPMRATGSQKWMVDTRGNDRISVEFDYIASVNAANQAIVTGRYAFFTGTQLFLEPLGNGRGQATVRFIVPDHWSIVSALQETSEPAVFEASSYEELVDAPTWLGAVEAHRFDVGGKPHVVAVESDRYPADTVAAFSRRLARIITAAAETFGALPYEKYVFFYPPGPPASWVTVLEHGNSVVMIDKELRNRGVAGEAHEFLHLWNGKRIRPAEMWPYDYSLPNETPSLWVTEGITRYYSDKVMYRAGFWSDTTFLQQLAQVIGYLEANPAARYVSPSDASMTAWQDYGIGRPFASTYYFTGHVIGALLDLSIINDTKGKRGLDDVMRTLYRDFYGSGRGFTADDFARTVNAVSGSDYGEFFARYVTGTEVPNVDQVLGHAGVRMVRNERILGFLGATHSDFPNGVRLDQVDIGGPAHLAGLEVGDVIVAAAGLPVQQVRMPYNCCITVNKGTDRVTITVMRSGRRLDTTVILQLGPTADSAEFDPGATPEQMVVRHAWLRR